VVNRVREKITSATLVILLHGRATTSDKRSAMRRTIAPAFTLADGAGRNTKPVLQVNEALTKVLCHNLCLVIQSMYELGVEPQFRLDAA